MIYKTWHRLSCNMKFYDTSTRICCIVWALNKKTLNEWFIGSVTGCHVISSRICCIVSPRYKPEWMIHRIWHKMSCTIKFYDTSSTMCCTVSPRQVWEHILDEVILYDNEWKILFYHMTACSENVKFGIIWYNSCITWCNVKLYHMCVNKCNG